MPRIEVKLPRSRHAVIAIRLLDQQNISEIACVTQKRQLVFIAARTVHLACVRQPKPRVTQQIERNIRQRNIFFEHRPVAAPLRQALAEDQAVIPEAQEIFKQSLIGSHIGSQRLEVSLLRQELHKTPDGGRLCCSPAQTALPFRPDCSP